MGDMNNLPQSTKPPFNLATNPHLATNPDETPFPIETESQEFHLPVKVDLPTKPSPPMAMHKYEPQGQFCNIEPQPQGYPQFSKPLKNSLSRIHLSPSTGRTPKGEKEAVAELLQILVDCMEGLNTRSRESLLRKFFSEVETDERLEKFIVERLRQSKVKAISDLCEKLPPSVLGQVGDSDGGISVSVENGKENESDSTAPNDGIQTSEFYGEYSYSESVEIYGTSSSSQRSLIENVEELSQELERFKIRTFDHVGGITKEEEKK